MKSDRDGLLVQLRQGDQQGAQDRVNTERGAAQEQIDITRQMEEEKNRLMEEGRAKELDALRIKYKYEQEEADKNFKEGKLKKADYDKLTNQMTESKRLDDKAINDKYDKIDGNLASLFQTFETRYNQRNQYDKFSILNNRIPSKQYYVSVVPDYVTVTYDCVLLTNYVEQNNKLIEAIEYASDS